MSRDILARALLESPLFEAYVAYLAKSPIPDEQLFQVAMDQMNQIIARLEAEEAADPRNTEPRWR